MCLTVHLQGAAAWPRVRSVTPEDMIIWDSYESERVRCSDLWHGVNNSGLGKWLIAIRNVMIMGKKNGVP